MRYVIGDIHGHARALHAILSALRLTPADHLILMGDYVDYGPDAKGVITQLMALRSKVQLTLLRGNHESLLLAARHDDDIHREWLRYGGEATLASFAVNHARDLPQDVVDFLASGLRFYETDNEIFVHAGLNPNQPLATQSDEHLLWQHLPNPIQLPSGKRLITAHTPRVEPYITPEFIGIDTGIGHGGWLTCLALDNTILCNGKRARFIQADALGQFRIPNDYAVAA